MSDWHEWVRSDKVLLAIILFAVLALWAWTRDEKVFRLIDMMSGALVGLLTGAALRAKNGNGPS